MLQKVVMTCLAGLALAMGGGAALPAQNQPQRKVVSVTQIGEMDYSSLVGFSVSSPDGRHFAYATRGADGQFVVVDGQPQKAYEGIVEGSLTWSPDSKHIAYIAQTNRRPVVVLDGIEGNPYDEIDKFSIRFSPNCTGFAYVARKGGRYFVVVNGDEGKPYEGIDPGMPVFSPDSKWMAYVGRAGGKFFVVVNAQEQQFDRVRMGTLTFSPNSRLLAFGAKVNEKWFVPVLGQDKPKTLEGNDDVLGVIFSPDSRQVACVTRLGAGYHVLVDGEMRGRDDFVEDQTLTFSPDGKRLAWVARREVPVVVDEKTVMKQKPLVRVDGGFGKEYEEIKGKPVFSPDSQRVAYAAKGLASEMVVVDGKEGKKYDEVEEESLSFSPDSKRVAYQAKRGGKYVVVLDWKEGKEYSHIEGLAFSPDGKHLAYDARLSEEAFVVVDEQEGRRFDYIYTDYRRRIVFDGPKKFHYLAGIGKKVYAVDEVLQ
jgi:Tol biopolymer transport system component